MKKFIIILIIIIAAIGIYALTRTSSDTVTPPPNNQEPTTPPPVATTTPPVVENKPQEVIGKSVGGTDILAYHYGTGSKEVLFVGGIHGGYEWNTSLVAHQLMDYLKDNPSKVPANVKVTVVPVLNPDGLAKVVTVGADGRFAVADVSTTQATLVSGRFNGNNVDLNRNFDCDWQASGTWQNKSVSGGSKAFSEPESSAVRAYIEAHDPAAVVAWYSAGGGVYASNCHTGVLPETKTILNTYAQASGYRAYDDFDFYEITGDFTNWLAKNNIPAISVLLSTHTTTEWTKNQAGIDALLAYYGK